MDGINSRPYEPGELAPALYLSDPSGATHRACLPLHSQGDGAKPNFPRKSLKVSAKLSERELGDRKSFNLKGGTMLIWCTVLLFLGLTAFLDSMFTFGDIFRRVNSVLFMLVSLGLLVRTATKIKLAQREGEQKRIQELERQVAELSKTQPKKEKVGAPN
jgi:hypothetical protein